MPSFLTQITRRKHLLQIAAARENNELHQHLTAAQLTSLGVGCIVGAGIFVITGQAAAIAAGPALAISFVLSAIACFFCGLCYAELSAAIPVSGSAYTFTYVAIGEYAAWFVAICLVLEYLVSTATVTVGWSASVQSFLGEFDIHIPSSLSRAPLQIGEHGSISLSGSFVNLPAVFINVLLTVILCAGVKESTKFNNVFVVIKLAVLAVFVGYGAHFAFTRTDAFVDNLTPFIPENTGKFGKFGLSGILRGAGMVFFSYVGFDAVCAMAQECKNPGKDLPRGLMYALLSCTVLYVLATISLTGMVKYNFLNVDDPVPHALSIVGAPPIIRYLVDIGAIAGLTSCCLVAQMCTPRLLFTLSRDGLVPGAFGFVHKEYRTPYFSTIFCGSLSAIISGLLPLNVLGEVVSAGTLMAFVMVCCSLIAFRRNHPDYPRPFRVPFVPLFPLIGIGLCLVQMASLPFRTILYYTLLQLAMFGCYWHYGRQRSVAATFESDAARGAQAQNVAPREETQTPRATESHTKTEMISIVSIPTDISKNSRNTLLEDPEPAQNHPVETPPTETPT